MLRLDNNAAFLHQVETKIYKAEYRGSYSTVEKCPDAAIPEFAFVGRSNCGKSSLINYLCSNPKLAHVSSTPGKTQSINYFLVNERWYWVDLPGYGYAKRSKTQREAWDKMLKSYISKRKQLAYIFQLVDSRIPPQKNDLEMISYYGEAGLPFVIVFTKADKPNSPEIRKNINSWKEQLAKDWEELPPLMLSSSSQNRGKEQIYEFVSAQIGEIEKIIEKRLEKRQ